MNKELSEEYKFYLLWFLGVLVSFLLVMYLGGLNDFSSFEFMLVYLMCVIAVFGIPLILMFIGYRGDKFEK